MVSEYQSYTCVSGLSQLALDATLVATKLRAPNPVLAHVLSFHAKKTIENLSEAVVFNFFYERSYFTASGCNFLQLGISLRIRPFCQSWIVHSNTHAHSHSRLFTESAQHTPSNVCQDSSVVIQHRLHCFGILANPGLGNLNLGAYSRAKYDQKGALHNNQQALDLESEIFDCAEERPSVSATW